MQVGVSDDKWEVSDDRRGVSDQVSLELEGDAFKFIH